MSQNKTVIQGLEPDNNPQSHPSGGYGSGGNSFYSRNSRPQGKPGTFVPGMGGGTQQAYHSATVEQQSGVQQPIRKTVHPGKPVVGFLYSVSRTPAGEFWPVQIGRNTIGQSSDNDIRLPEGTVSASHAVLVTRQVKGHIIAAITDAMSTNGTMINGETIGFTAESCKNGDIITIGTNYQLLLILIDAAQLGLSVSDDFIPVESEEDESEDDIPSFDPNSTRPGGYYSEEGYRPSGGTVGLDGNIAGSDRGGTVSM